MRVCYSLLLLRRRTALLFSSRLLMKRTKEYMRDHHHRIKKRERSLVDDETPSVCTEHAKRCIKIDRKKRELFFVSPLRVVLKQRRRDGVVLRGKEGNISPLLFLNERFDQKTFCCFTTQEIRIILAYAALFDIIRILILL